MRRFNFDDSEEGKRDVDGFLGGDDDNDELTPEEYEAIVTHQAFLAQMQLEAVHKELNLRLLSRVVRMLERKIFWRFYSHDTQLRMIAKSYRLFERLAFGEVKD